MPTTRPMPQPGEPLTVRELEVLTLAADGLLLEEVGAKLFISLDTVKTHLIRLRRKLGARNCTHAVALALKAGLIGGEP